MIGVNINRNTKLSQRIGYMTYSQEAKRYAKHLIDNYASYDRFDYSQKLSIGNVPDFDLSEFVAILIKNGDVDVNEATGADNALYKSHMVPALTKYLTDITDSISKQEFLEAWQSGVANYFSDTMQEIINDQLI